MDHIEKMPVRLRVADIIRKAILSGEFADGEALSLTDTAARLKVSRTPVREAFQLLESEGLIELRMNREAIVRKIDEKFVTDHFEMRILLEGEAVERAIRNRMDPAPLIELQNSITRPDTPLTAALYDSYNQKFHQLVWKAANNEKLYAFLDSLWNGPSYSRTVGSNVNHALSVAEHAEIIACVQQGNAAEGRKVMDTHMRRSMEIILATIRGGK